MSLMPCCPSDRWGLPGALSPASLAPRGTVGPIGVGWLAGPANADWACPVAGRPARADVNPSQARAPCPADSLAERFGPVARLPGHGLLPPLLSALLPNPCRLGASARSPRLPRSGCRRPAAAGALSDCHLCGAGPSGLARRTPEAMERSQRGRWGSKQKPYFLFKKTASGRHNLRLPGSG